MVSGNPTSTSIPRVDGLSTDPLVLGRHGQSLVKIKGFLSPYNIFISRQILARVKRFYVATENLMSRQSCLKLCCDKVYLALRQRVAGHGVSHVAKQCSMSRKLGTALHRNKAGLVHDKDESATEVFCRDILGIVVKKKKKKTLGIWGVIAWYQSLGL